MPGSFESVRWNVCAHRLYLGLCSHPKEFLGHGVRTHVNSKGKMPSNGQKKSLLWAIEPMTQHQAGQPAQHTTNHTASSRTASPTHYQPHSIKQDSQPNTLPTTQHQAGQPAQHTTNHTASSRTASPTHYQPHSIKQDSQPNTLPTTQHQAGQPAQHTTNELFRHPEDISRLESICKTFHDSDRKTGRQRNRQLGSETGRQRNS